jgi:hypothetical protein
MAIMTPALMNVNTPEEAIAKAFRDQGVITPAHLQMHEIEADDFGDRAWAWTLAPEAPVIRDLGGQPFSFDAQTKKVSFLGDEARFRFKRGVVLERADYGAMYVAADTGEDESDATLVEMAASMVGVGGTID